MASKTKIAAHKKKLPRSKRSRALTVMPAVAVAEHPAMQILRETQAVNIWLVDK